MTMKVLALPKGIKEANQGELNYISRHTPKELVTLSNALCKGREGRYLIRIPEKVFCWFVLKGKTYAYSSVQFKWELDMLNARDFQIPNVPPLIPYLPQG